MANENKSGAAAAVGSFFGAIGGFFSSFGTAVAQGDFAVKLSLLWMGAGYAKRKQYVKAAIMTLLEIAVILFTVFFAMDYVPKFGTLGTVAPEQVFNMTIPSRSCCFPCLALLSGLHSLSCGLRM